MARPRPFLSVPLTRAQMELIVFPQSYFLQLVLQSEPKAFEIKQIADLLHSAWPAGVAGGAGSSANASIKCEM